jgi:colanic acid biosynthesis glycosyl transferase WcaI
MRILILTQYFPPEKVGPAVWLKELAEDLLTAGHEVNVLTAFPNYPNGVIPPPYRHKLYQREELDGAHVFRTYIYATQSKAFWRRVADFGSFIVSSLLGGALAGPRTDVIYAILPPLPLGLTACVLGWLKSAKVVVNIQDIHPDVAVAVGVLRNRAAIRFFKWMEKWIYRHAYAIVVISEGFRQNLLAKGVLGSKIRVVSNWADPDLIRPGPADPSLRESWGKDKFIVVYSGGLTHNSNLECVIQALDLLQNEPFRLVIIGEGVKKHRLEEDVQVRGLDNVLFKPFGPLERYPTVLRSADMNLVTLNSSAAIASVPSKIFKMMASGRPVLAVAPPQSEIARLVKSADCGICIESGDPKDLAEALHYAYAHREEIDQMGMRGRKYLEEHFSRRIWTGEIARILSETAGMGREKTTKSS